MFNGNIKNVLKKWGKINHVNDDIVKLFDTFFKYEENRINIEQIKNSKYYRT